MSWSGVKKQANRATIEAWCDKMGIENYTINSQGEIDVDDNVNLSEKDFEELPHKFGEVKGYFSLRKCKNLISLKNCPKCIGGWFSCSFCDKLIAAGGCPQKVYGDFYCVGCPEVIQIQKEILALYQSIREL